jgi:O-6-methylguanine DNA methyltransferase
MQNYNSSALFCAEISTPIGELIATASISALIALDFKDRLTKIPTNFDNNKILELTKYELDLYFKNKLKFFSIALEPYGTEFYKKAWQVLQNIEYGKTISYSDEAKILNSHPRAVARANALNKIPIIIPCHRVIAKNGTLSGYAGGVWRKEFLLDLESKTV